MDKTECYFDQFIRTMLIPMLVESRDIDELNKIYKGQDLNIFSEIGNNNIKPINHIKTQKDLDTIEWLVDRGWVNFDQLAIVADVMDNKKKYYYDENHYGYSYDLEPGRLLHKMAYLYYTCDLNGIELDYDILVSYSKDSTLLEYKYVFERAAEYCKPLPIPNSKSARKI